eukprot:4852712-Prymnesium_polylepis.1
MHDAAGAVAKALRRLDVVQQHRRRAAHKIAPQPRFLLKEPVALRALHPVGRLTAQGLAPLDERQIERSRKELRLVGRQPVALKVRERANGRKQPSRIGAHVSRAHLAQRRNQLLGHGRRRVGAAHVLEQRLEQWVVRCAHLLCQHSATQAAKEREPPRCSARRRERLGGLVARRR